MTSEAIPRQGVTYRITVEFVTDDPNTNEFFDSRMMETTGRVKRMMDGEHVTHFGFEKVGKRK